MFEFETKSLFFEGFSRKHPSIVRNIEIVSENIKLIDASYHNPKLFMLNLNNLLRSILFFIENSLKNSPEWLKNSISNYRESNFREYEILKRLRDVSIHQDLILPDESIVTGLYRIYSQDKYRLKLGMGDHNSPRKYSFDLTLKNTDEIFHDMLVFENFAYMDLEHSSIGECLGITRKWFLKINFKNKHTGNKYNEVIDIYNLIYGFSTNMLDLVVKSYADDVGIEADVKFNKELAEHNYINTLLEIDIYPSLFSEWWEEPNIEPLSFGVNYNRRYGDQHMIRDYAHMESYKNLCTTPEQYKSLLLKYNNMPLEDIVSKDNYKSFVSFIYINHWHCKKALNCDGITSEIGAEDIMMLKRYGKIFLQENDKKKLCTILSSGEQLKAQLKLIADKI